MTITRREPKDPSEATWLLLCGLGALTAMSLFSVDKTNWEPGFRDLTNIFATFWSLLLSICYWYNYADLYSAAATAGASPACGAMSYIIYRGFVRGSFPTYGQFFLGVMWWAHAAFHLEVWNGWCTRLLQRLAS